MSSFPNDSAIKVQPGSSLEKEIASASSVSEIQEILHRAAVSQHLIEPDPLDRDGKDYFNYKPVEPGSSPRGYATTVTIDGVKHVLEAGTEQELLAKETALYRAALAAPAATTQAEIEAEAARVAALEQPRNERGQFITHNPEAVALAPTVAAALEAQGISVDDLREFTANKRGDAYQHSWEEARTEFVRQNPSWCGGTENMNLFARLLGENPELADAEDKVGSLNAVYAYALEHNLLSENPELTAREAIGKAQTYDELKAAVGHHDSQENGGGFWGR